ncbi:hypothetical protein D3C73_1365570 [compost metagenome]
MIFLVIPAQLGDFPDRIIRIHQIAAGLLVLDVHMIFLRPHAGMLQKQLPQIRYRYTVFLRQLLHPVMLHVIIFQPALNLFKSGKSPRFHQAPVCRRVLMQLVEQNLQLGPRHSGSRVQPRQPFVMEFPE